MIAILRGEVAEKTVDQVVLDVGGVGYGLLVTTEDHGRLATGTPAKLYIYEHIREAAYDLYGFLARDTKALFEQLLGVNGIGPKMALSMLSIGNTAEVRGYIASGNVKALQQANGVGKRVAERVVVELKDKVGLASVDLAAAGLLQSEQSLAQDQAAEALMALGYSAQDASRALAHVDNNLSTEERIKLALKAGR